MYEVSENRFGIWIISVWNIKAYNSCMTEGKFCSKEIFVKIKSNPPKGKLIPRIITEPLVALHLQSSKTQKGYNESKDDLSFVHFLTGLLRMARQRQRRHTWNAWVTLTRLYLRHMLQTPMILAHVLPIDHHPSHLIDLGVVIWRNAAVMGEKRSEAGRIRAMHVTY